MRNFATFPRGYRVPSNETLEVAGSNETDTLFKEGILLRKINEFDMMTTALNLAHELIGTTFDEFYSANMDNDYLGNNGLLFLEDTMIFIMTGKRRLSVENWTLMLNEKAVKNTDPRAKLLTYKELVNQNGIPAFGSKHYVSQWISQPNGLIDLIKSMNLLFGDVRGPSSIGRIPYSPETHRAIFGLSN